MHDSLRQILLIQRANEGSGSRSHLPIDRPPPTSSLPASITSSTHSSPAPPFSPSHHDTSSQCVCGLPNGVCVEAPTCQTCPTLLELPLIPLPSLRPSAFFSLQLWTGPAAFGEGFSTDLTLPSGSLSSPSPEPLTCTVPAVSEQSTGSGKEARVGVGVAVLQVPRPPLILTREINRRNRL